MVRRGDLLFACQVAIFLRSTIGGGEGPALLPPPTHPAPSRPPAADTHEGTTKDRAHVHFECKLLGNDRFAAWHQKTMAGQRNDHGEWNGQNLLGIDPRAILLEQQERGSKFSLLDFLHRQTELCRVQVRKTDFPWLKRYKPLIRRNPVAEKEGVAGYELALNFNGVAFEVVPRAASEMRGKSRIELLSVNEAEYHKNPCRRLVSQHGKSWELTNHGMELLEMLVF